MRRSSCIMPPPTTIAIVALSLWGLYGLLALTGLAPTPQFGSHRNRTPLPEETLPATITRETACEQHQAVADASVAESCPANARTADTPPSDPLMETELYEAINRARATTGLPALIAHPLLESSACTKADDMIARNYWSHTAPDGTNPWHVIERTGYVYYKAGENLAQGHQTARTVVDAWMNSAGHRENILGSYSEMGLCVRSGVQYQGRVTSLIVNHFGVQR